jgi:hypothetical protein
MASEFEAQLVISRVRGSPGQLIRGSIKPNRLANARCSPVRHPRKLVAI